MANCIIRAIPIIETEHLCVYVDDGTHQIEVYIFKTLLFRCQSNHNNPSKIVQRLVEKEGNKMLSRHNISRCPSIGRKQCSTNQTHSGLTGYKPVYQN